MSPAERVAASPALRDTVAYLADLVAEQQAEIERLRATAEPARDALRETLAACDAFMSGREVGSATKALADRAFLAAAFASAAYEKGCGGGQGTYAMLRSFLVAMIDPAAPDLDYLRACKQHAVFGPHCMDGAAIGPLCDYCGKRHEGACEGRA